MNGPFDHDEFELTPEQIEDLLGLYREQLGADVDVTLLQEVARNAVVAHPEREQLVEADQAAARTYSSAARGRI